MLLNPISMKCKTCSFENLGQFTAEIAIHFPGWPRVSEPAVFVYPKLMVCWNCGAVEFVMSKEELNQLANGMVKGAT